MRLTAALLQEIVDAVRAALPVEAVGLLVGADEPTRYVAMSNASASPYRYSIGEAEQLREFIGPVGDELEDDETLRELGWTLEIRRAVLDMCERVAERPEWAALVHAGLEAESLETFHQADAAAHRRFSRRSEPPPAAGHRLRDPHGAGRAELRGDSGAAQRIMPR